MARSFVTGMRHVVVEEIGIQVHNRRPSTIRGHDGLGWVVEQVLDHWEHRGRMAGGLMRPPKDYNAESQRWRLIVVGPLPGQPHVRGEQEVILTAFSCGGGWWMGRAAQAPPPGELRLSVPS